jgi:zinc D-Ala-D-Ala dipeptidase
VGKYRDERPVINENNEPLIQVWPIQNRLFIQSSYYERNVPHSLKSLYLREQTVKQLLIALSYLPQNYSFILYDGFRPLEIQRYLFEEMALAIQKANPAFSAEQVQQETLKYVAYPSIDEGYPAPHLTGGAIDLTLGDEYGKPLDMGTDFDEASAKSATDYYEKYPDENSIALKNRRLLFHSMTNAGFQNYEEEWWHYDFGNVTWARKTNATHANYGPIIAQIEGHELKEYRFK